MPMAQFDRSHPCVYFPFDIQFGAPTVMRKERFALRIQRQGDLKTDFVENWQQSRAGKPSFPVFL